MLQQNFLNPYNRFAKRLVSWRTADVMLDLPGIINYNYNCNNNYYYDYYAFFCFYSVHIHRMEQL